MSYAPVLSHASPRPLRGLGLGSLLDANLNTQAYYINFVELWDKTLGLRKYYWSPIKYLNNWDAVGFTQSYSIPQSYSAPTYQMSTLYQWDSSSQSWKKTLIPRM
jgi:hypothetical protein